MEEDDQFIHLKFTAMTAATAPFVGAFLAGILVFLEFFVGEIRCLVSVVDCLHIRITLDHVFMLIGTFVISVPLAMIWWEIFKKMFPSLFRRKAP